MSKRILVNYTGRTKAGPVFAYEMTKGLLDNGAEVYAVVSAQAENIEDWRTLPLKRLIELNTYTNKWEFIRRTIIFYLWGRSQLIHAFDGERFDAIYCPMVTLWTRMINRVFPHVPLFFTLHDPVAHEGGSVWNKWILADKTREEAIRAKKVILLTEIFCEVVQRRYGRSSEDILVIPHGVFDYDRKAKTESPALFEKRNNQMTFLFFGRIEDYKGIDILLEAYQQLEDITDNVQLVVAGEGDFSRYGDGFSKLKSAVLINRNIKDDEVAALFEGEKIVTVLPYRNATQSGVINIAMTHHSLVIAASVGGLPEQLQNGKLGVLIPPLNVEGLRNTMVDVAMNYAGYELKIKKAYTYMEKFTWKSLAQRLLAEI